MALYQVFAVTPARAESPAGLWIGSDNGQFASEASIAKTLKFAKDQGLNEAYVLAYGRGTRLFEQDVDSSSDIPDSPGAYSSNYKNVLNQALQNANGIQVIPWMEGGLKLSVIEANKLLNSNRADWVSKGADGSAVFRNDRAEGQFAYLNPFNPDVQKAYARMVTGLANKPGVKAIQLDDNFSLNALAGYDAYTQNLYAKEHGGRNPPKMPTDKAWGEWVQWRAGKITKFFGDLCASMPSGKSIYLSPNPAGYSTNHYLADWESWVKQPACRDVVKRVTVQVFRKDPEKFKSALQGVVASKKRLAASGSDVKVGVGVLAMPFGEDPVHSQQVVSANLQDIASAVSQGLDGGVNWFGVHTLKSQAGDGNSFIRNFDGNQFRNANLALANAQAPQVYIAAVPKAIQAPAVARSVMAKRRTDAVPSLDLDAPAPSPQVEAARALVAKKTSVPEAPAKHVEQATAKKPIAEAKPAAEAKPVAEVKPLVAALHKEVAAPRRAQTPIAPARALVNVAPSPEIELPAPRELASPIHGVLTVPKEEIAAKPDLREQVKKLNILEQKLVGKNAQGEACTVIVQHEASWFQKQHSAFRIMVYNDRDLQAAKDDRRVFQKNEFAEASFFTDAQQETKSHGVPPVSGSIGSVMRKMRQGGFSLPTPDASGGYDARTKKLNFQVREKYYRFTDNAPRWFNEAESRVLRDVNGTENVQYSTKVTDVSADMDGNRIRNVEMSVADGSPKKPKQLSCLGLHEAGAALANEPASSNVH